MGPILFTLCSGIILFLVLSSIIASFDLFYYSTLAIHKSMAVPINDLEKFKTSMNELQLIII